MAEMDGSAIERYNAFFIQDLSFDDILNLYFGYILPIIRLIIAFFLTVIEFLHENARPSSYYFRPQHRDEQRHAIPPPQGPAVVISHEINATDA